MHHRDWDLDLGEVFRRVVYPSFLLFLFWATAWISLLYFQNPPTFVGLWFRGTIFPYWPFLGFLAAVYGVLSGDGLGSFLMGLVPIVLDFVLIYSILPAYDEYAGLQMIYSLLTFIAVGMSFGIAGFGGSLYGRYRGGYGTARSLRLSVLFFILGIVFSLAIIYVWPGYSATLPYRIL